MKPRIRYERSDCIHSREHQRLSRAFRSSARATISHVQRSSYFLLENDIDNATAEALRAVEMAPTTRDRTLCWAGFSLAAGRKKRPDFIWKRL